MPSNPYTPGQVPRILAGRAVEMRRIEGLLARVATYGELGGPHEVVATDVAEPGPHPAPGLANAARRVVDAEHASLQGHGIGLSGARGLRVIPPLVHG